jgi:hypothetical protein
MTRSCCIKDYCGMPFDSAIPEQRDVHTLRPFWQLYCPKHRPLLWELLFRELTPEEEKEFREYAEANDPPDLKSWELYHPVCREVWIKRGVGPTGEGI